MIPVQRTLSVALAAAILTSAAQAAPISQGLAAALDQAGSRKVRVIVQMKDAEKVTMSGAQSVGDSASRIAKLKAFRRNAQKSQADLLGSVQTFGAANALDEKPKSFWLSNSVAMDADKETVEKLAARGDVAEVFLNETIPAPKVEQSVIRDGDAKFTWGLERVRVPEVWALYKLTGAGVRVGHLDSGITGTHPDLKDKILLFKDFSQKAAKEPYDDGGHGSHTAGTIAGGNASGKHIGVAPDARLIVGKIFGEGGATLEGIMGAMEWVVDPDGNPETDDGAQIVSNSWGSDNSQNRAFWNPVKKWVDLGVFPCFAGGNNGPNTVGTPGGFPHSFAVGATDPDDACSEFSSRGPVSWNGKEYIKPDVAAPGSSVLSAWHTGNGYNAIQGTSMACPHVSGIVALLLQANPKLTIDRIREILESTAEDKGDTGKDNLFGAGIVNAWKAVAQVVPSGVIAGALQNEAGQGVKGEVALADFGITVVTDDQGKFTLTVPAGDYKVTAKAFGLKPQTIDFKVAAGSSAGQDIKLAKAVEGKLAGTVVNKDGKALKATLSFPNTGLAAVETNADSGAFEVSVPQGLYTLVVKSFGYEPKTITGLEVGALTNGYKVILDTLPEILLVDDDGHDKTDSYIADSLTRNGHRFSAWDGAVSGAPTADVLIQYPIVIWHTGFDYKTAFTPQEQEAVKKYLKSGGHMFLSGQLAGVQLRGTPFYSEVFHAKFVTIIRRGQVEVPNIDTAEPLGAPITFALNGPESQDNQDYPNIIAPFDDKAKPAFKYQGESRGVAGIAVEDGASKLLYAAFGFEGIKSAASRDALMKAAYGYLKPTAQDVLARVEALDQTRTELLAAKSSQANAYFEYEEYFVKRATAALQTAPDRDAILSKFASTCKATDALRAIRRATAGEQ